MRYFYALSLLLALGLGRSVHAQQPFLKYGVTVKVATLSNGRFQEFFTNDSLRRIGSVVYDTRLHRVAYLLPPDSLVGHAKPDITSRWISPDPLAEKFMYSTPYAFADNNPIRYNDPDGREFTEGAQKLVDRYNREIQSRIDGNNKQITKLQGQIDGGGLSDKKVAHLNNRIGGLQSSNAGYQGIQGEITTLSNSSQMYDIQTTSDASSPMGVSTTQSGQTGFNFQTGVVEISVPSSGGLGLLAHELKHAYQFETGEFSVGRTIPGVPYSLLLNDKTDEVAAYARGAMFGGGTAYGLNSLPSIYDNRPTGPYNINNVPEIKSALGAARQDYFMQNAAINSGHAFRVDGKTYYKKKE